MNLYDELEWRGLVHDASEGAKSLLASDGPPPPLYIGFDPTAPSLHVGSLLPLLTLARAQRLGHPVVALVGGGTGMIGDPSGKSKERHLLDADEIDANVAGLKAQIARLVAFDDPARQARLLDNRDWLGDVRLLEFLRDVGKHFTVNAMLAKESVRRRVESEQGISWTEFSYLVLQAYDYLVLHERHGCRLQLGGSDQWGNIVSGIDLIRARTGHHVHGITFPLITNASGQKFGKSEAGAVWLDAAMTSPYDFYQFWIRTDDRDVGRYLRFFTLLERAEIGEIEREHLADPSKRVGHRRLADEVTRLVHGADRLEAAIRETESLFRPRSREAGIAADAFVADAVFDLPPGCVSAAASPLLLDVLVLAAVVPSKKEGRRLVESGGIYVNDVRVEDAGRRLTRDDLRNGAILVRKGKKHYTVLHQKDA